MALSVAGELAGSRNVPCALFGHSLGALVAYETAIFLRDLGFAPSCLLVSGSLPPRQAGSRRLGLSSDGELWSAVCELGGIAPEIAAEDELVELLLPILRADISAHENYQPRADADPLSCPVRCYHGVDDPLVDVDRLAGWAEISTGEFTLHARKGGHFHPFTDPDSLVEDILTTLVARPVSGSGENMTWSDQ